MRRRRSISSLASWFGMLWRCGWATEKRRKWSMPAPRASDTAVWPISASARVEGRADVDDDAHAVHGPAHLGGIRESPTTGSTPSRRSSSFTSGAMSRARTDAPAATSSCTTARPVSPLAPVTRITSTPLSPPSAPCLLARGRSPAAAIRNRLRRGDLAHAEVMLQPRAPGPRRQEKLAAGAAHAAGPGPGALEVVALARGVDGRATAEGGRPVFDRETTLPSAGSCRILRSCPTTSTIVVHRGIMATARRSH